MAHDHKAGGVDGMGQLFQLRQLAVAHDAQQHLLWLVAVASLAMQHGHAAVQLDEDGFADIIGVLADDLYLGAGSAEDEHLVQHHRIHDHHHDAVQTLLQRAERRLQAEDEHIEHQHTGRHRDVEIFVQHQRRARARKSRKRLFVPYQLIVDA